MDYYGDAGIFLYLPPIVSGLCFAFALLIKKGKTMPQSYLAVCLFVISAGMAAIFVYDRYFGYDNPSVLRPVNLIVSMTVAAAVMLYFFALMSPETLTRKYLTACAAGTLLFAVAAYGCERIGLLVAGPVLFALLAAFEIYIAATVIYKYRKHKKFIREHYSYVEKIELGWVRWVILLFTTLAVCYLLKNIVPGVKIVILFNLLSLVVIVSLYVIGSQQGRIPLINDVIPSRREDAPPYSKKTYPDVKQDKESKVEAELIRYFETSAAYLDIDLSLVDVARAIGVNESYLSRLINSRLGMNFYTFVNNYRIDRAISLIEENGEALKSDFICAEAGFKSRSVFYKLFRERTGLSPLEYKKSLESVKSKYF